MSNSGQKTYVITGATSGIGNALVKKFCQENIVFAGYRNADYIEDLNKISKNIKPFYIDMEKKASIKDAADYIKSHTSCVDILINAAGCVVAGAMEKIEVDDIRKQFEVNTFSHLDFTQRLLPILDNGRIINISSMAGFGIFPFVAPYCASKRALDILFNLMSVETHKNIKVISVKPGVIATPLWEKSIKLNEKTIQNSECFEKEMKFMVNNAQKNGKNGLDVNKVVDLISKICTEKNPKSSYTIGKDAEFASFISKFPQDFINALVKLGLNKRINK